MVFVLVFSLKSFRASMIIFCVGIFSFGMAFFSLWATGFALGFTAIVGTMGHGRDCDQRLHRSAGGVASRPAGQLGDLDSIIKLVMRSTRHVLSTTFTVGCSFGRCSLKAERSGRLWPCDFWWRVRCHCACTVLDSSSAHPAVPAKAAPCGTIGWWQSQAIPMAQW